MGKAKHFKQIRKIAAGLPVLHTNIVLSQITSGKNLIEKGITETAKGKKIDEKVNYRRKRSVAVPMNHYRKMKGYYSKHGYEGVKAYAIAVQREASRLKILKERAEQKVS